MMAVGSRCHPKLDICGDCYNKSGSCSNASIICGGGVA